MKTPTLIAFFLVSSISITLGQNYFTGELFESYEWNLVNLNNIDLELESNIVLRRRMLSKKEETIGYRIKENKQFFDEVLINKKSKLEVIKIRDNKIKVKFSKKSDFALYFGPDDMDNENYIVVVDEMKGHKGVAEYDGMPFRVLNGSRLTMSKLKKKHLPEKRKQKISSQWDGNGTGILIDKRGFLITNSHVVEDAREIVVFSPQSGGIELKAKLVLEDQDNDLALLKIEDDRYSAPARDVPFSIITDVQDIGTEVFTLGYPLALSSMGEEIKFSEGSINAKTGYNDNTSMYQISVPIQPGNSGGPLFNKQGHLIGIVNAKIIGDSIENVAYAIKSTFAKVLIESSNENIVIPKGEIDSDLTSMIKELDDFVFMVKTD